MPKCNPKHMPFFKNVKFDKDGLTLYCRIIGKLIYFTNIWPILHMQWGSIASTWVSKKTPLEGAHHILKYLKSTTRLWNILQLWRWKQNSWLYWCRLGKRQWQKRNPPLTILIFGKSPITWCPKKQILTIALNSRKIE